MNYKWKVVDSCIDTYIVEDTKDKPCVAVLKRTWVDSEQNHQYHAQMIALLPELVEGVQRACFSCGRFEECHKCQVHGLRERLDEIEEARISDI